LPAAHISGTERRAACTVRPVMSMPSTPAIRNSSGSKKRWARAAPPNRTSHTTSAWFDRVGRDVEPPRRDALLVAGGAGCRKV
jgi:hypothetical protein